MSVNNKEQERMSFELLANVPIDNGSNFLALVSDGSVFYNGRPCISGGEAVELDENEAELLRILLDNTETPMSGDFIWHKGYGNEIVTSRQLNEKLESDLSKLGSILQLDSRIVRVGTAPRTYYTFTTDAGSLGKIINAYDSGKLVGKSINKNIFSRYANRETYWYGAEQVPTTKATQSVGALATKATVKNTKITHKNKVVPAQATAEPTGIDRLISVQVPIEVTAIRNRLSNIPGLNQELDKFDNLEMLIIAELVNIPRNGRENFANIFERLLNANPSLKEISPNNLRDKVLGLIGKPISSVPRYLPKKFSLRVRMTEQERWDKHNGEEVLLGNECFFVQRD